MSTTISTAPPGPHRGFQAHPATGELPDRFTELDPTAEAVVICHHGARSAQVTQALERAGFAKVLILEGGLDPYAGVEGSVPR